MPIHYRATSPGAKLQEEHRRHEIVAMYHKVSAEPLVARSTIGAGAREPSRPVSAGRDGRANAAPWRLPLRVVQGSFSSRSRKSRRTSASLWR